MPRERKKRALSPQDVDQGASSSRQDSSGDESTFPEHSYAQDKGMCVN